MPPAASIENQLLAALPRDCLLALQADIKEVRLPQDDVLLEPGDPVERVYFPLSGMISLVVVMKEGTNVRGLNTAATLWGSAAVGACAGADMVAQAVLLTAFILMTNTLLRPLVNAINRLPFDERASEATYEVRLTTDIKAVPLVREQLSEKLEAAKYPVSEIEEIDRTEETIELVAVLMSTSVNSKELDAVTNALATQPGVRHATWSVRTVE